MIKDIVANTKSDSYEVYLTSDDKSNFRHEIYTEYKANRKAPKPLWYGELRAYLTDVHKAVVVVGREADDALADRQTVDTILCTIDKDLDQIAGKHYDFVKDVIYERTAEEGLRFFYYQLLVGDRTDNIKGIEGVGPVGAKRILEGVESNEPELFRAVRAAYEETYGRQADEMMLLNGRLLKIGGKLWEMPVVQEAQSEEISSSPILNDTLTLS